MELVKVIGPKRFGIRMAEKIKVKGDPKIKFSYDDTSDLMTMTLTISFKVPREQINNKTTGDTSIKADWGDLLVANFGEDLEMKNPDELNFIYDSENTKITMTAAIPPGDKGNHSS